MEMTKEHEGCQPCLPSLLDASKSWKKHSSLVLSCAGLVVELHGKDL